MLLMVPITQQWLRLMGLVPVDQSTLSSKLRGSRQHINILVGGVREVLLGTRADADELYIKSRCVALQNLSNTFDINDGIAHYIQWICNNGNKKMYVTCCSSKPVAVNVVECSRRAASQINLKETVKMQCWTTPSFFLCVCVRERERVLF